MFHVSLSCAQYTKIAEKVAQVVAGKGCTAAGIATCTAADVALGTTACQLAGIGPEDPASWICTIAVDSTVTWGCSQLCAMAVSDAVNPILQHMANCPKV